MAIGMAILLSLLGKGDGTRRKGFIPGRLGIPFLGETFSFLAATNSTKGCYDFVKQRRQWYGQWFKTRIFGKIHVFLPNVEAAKTVFANDFVLFNKGYVKSMGDAVGKKSLLVCSSRDFMEGSDVFFLILSQ
ncbi:abscisic acid 8'-hydroxylase 1-like [Forsythia ovata]|uniref:Abscisic acid 8'-hydroxylase 1-like n=1 Tax=Forsythia ovata TaxID=205694 RepID=A0ABD1U6C1_9LAMI